jgi:regulatory protein
MDLAVRYLARWDRTVAQVEQFLLHRGASPTQAQHVIRRLSDLRYLDDHAYAERWIERRLARHPMGRARLKAELRARGVEESLADEVTDRVVQAADEEDLARRALKTKQRKGRRYKPAQALRLLRLWGFEEETIARIIKLRDEPE